MYFPYLRGRQFELIALRELVEKNVLSSKVIPIIEPVKLSSTLIKTIEVYNTNERDFAIITNPSVGNFAVDMKEEKNEIGKDRFLEVVQNSNNIIFMLLLKKNAPVSKFIEKHHNNMGIICTDKDSVPVYEQNFLDKEVRYSLIPDESGFRRKIRKNRVMFEDKFKRRERNNDYSGVEDEPFSEDHLYYSEDGYIGFSDYSIIGEEYSETGFAPYAVAIHIVYFDDDKSLRVAHFVSDSNDDISDPAGKFQEALTKLVAWNKQKKLDTVAMKEFEDLYTREVYPGLGTVKKLSIMHHLELVGRYLDKE